MTKKIYGASRVSQPVQINSDRAMVFAVTAMRVFSNITLVMFLERSCKILHGVATFKELQLTVIHNARFILCEMQEKLLNKQ